ncbi:hypothetical protein SAMN02745883_01021 [Caminicella sporogenes DSM 14501]|uniref:Uracil-DNA glycosylase n=1 Tax=Caminicella sporogenes DSM 14501 TaxID=1121266 RepID=A0A1M6NXX7_9FIRM|nr:uracil-DNA glycosylase [Caminicella sporogenes]RKD21602.1 uracil-DNA glycosylase [Caminicella sporogenes]WIF94113.1 uracil-DNA glycosylase [Caminicella sporogenes]SHK00543.1 hypothetical protein SAMN02745883_01021 [Caminicella sporogenes DSM 14501]
MTENTNINCFKCKYFFITWDINNPRGCSYFGFKSKQLPSVIVYKSSGKKCYAFYPKKNKG